MGEGNHQAGRGGVEMTIRWICFGAVVIHGVGSSTSFAFFVELGLSVTACHLCLIRQVLSAWIVSETMSQ